ncbi:MAG: DNA mismatch repair protein MutS, partial [Neisseria animaloris]|nr:DNA mismatch repair protein MutS [Neisseria animaloris]
KLAGLPARALKSAHKHLNGLEAQAAANRPQLDIFNMMPSENQDTAWEENETEPASAPHPALEALKTVNPDELSPREALEWVYKLKGLSEES